MYWKVEFTPYFNFFNLKSFIRVIEKEVCLLTGERRVSKNIDTCTFTVYWLIK